MTVTLKFNARQKGAQSLLQGMLDSGIFTKIATDGKKEKPLYDPAFVKMVKEAKKGPKRILTPALQKKLLGL